MWVLFLTVNLTINNVFKVPEIPKKPEEKVPVPIPKKEKAPPAKGTALNATIYPCSVTWWALPMQCNLVSPVVMLITLTPEHEPEASCHIFISKCGHWNILLFNMCVFFSGEFLVENKFTPSKWPKPFPSLLCCPFLCSVFILVVFIVTLLHV